MKNLTKKIFCAMLAVIFSVSLFPLSAYAYNLDFTRLIEPKGTCTNHNYSDFGGYNLNHNQHTYYCVNPGCTAYEVEECYNWDFCGYHQDTDTLSCQKCAQGTVYIHNYEPYHDFGSDELYHTLTCTNTDLYGDVGMCGKTSGSTIDCTLGPRYIHRGFVENRGHYLTQSCTGCGHVFYMGYYYPPDHPNYFDENSGCVYCQMDNPPYMEW